MKKFIVQCIDDSGSNIVKILEAESKDDAACIARKLQFYPLSIRPYTLLSTTGFGQQGADAHKRQLATVLIAIGLILLVALFSTIIVANNAPPIARTPEYEATVPSFVASMPSGQTDDAGQVDIDFAIERDLVEFEKRTILALGLLDKLDAKYQLINLGKPMEPRFLGNEYVGADEHMKWSNERKQFEMQFSEDIVKLNKNLLATAQFIDEKYRDTRNNSLVKERLEDILRPWVTRSQKIMRDWWPNGYRGAVTEMFGTP